VNRLIRAAIDTHALRHNLKVIRERARGARVMAMVKANAYGHGLVPTALALADAECVWSGEARRGAHVTRRRYHPADRLLEGVFAPEHLLEAARHGFDLVVHDMLQIELLEESTSPQRFLLWIKIDTGMNRLGFRPSEFDAALERIRRLQPAPLEIRLMTHLARADEQNNAETRRQLVRFKEATRGLDYARSIANSAGIFGSVPLGCDWVRPGLALYGGSPFADRSGVELGLQPVMSLETSVIATRNVPLGESVGYGAPGGSTRLGHCNHRRRLRRWSRPQPGERHSILIDGRRAPLVGRVSMDMIAVDVTDLSGVHVGTPVVLWGAGLPVEEIALHAGTTPYELLCGVSQRVPLELR